MALLLVDSVCEWNGRAGPAESKDNELRALGALVCQCDASSSFSATFCQASSLYGRSKHEIRPPPGKLSPDVHSPDNSEAATAGAETGQVESFELEGDAAQTATAAAHAKELFVPPRLAWPAAAAAEKPSTTTQRRITGKQLLVARERAVRE